MLDRGTKSTIDKRGIDYLFGDVQSFIKQSDFCIANFECTACDLNLKPTEKQCTFRTNPIFLYDLKHNGITHLNVANNHSFDFGIEGFNQTRNNITKSQIQVLGARQYNQPIIICKNNIGCAIFSSCLLKTGNSEIYDTPVYELVKEIENYKSKNKGNTIIVNLHWGIEKQLQVTDQQINDAHKLIDAGADIIIGHHPHVVQSIERYKGKLIFYSIGNFLFDNSHHPANKGLMVSLSIESGKIDAAMIYPFILKNSKPQPLNKQENDLFLSEVITLSTHIKIKQDEHLWKIE